MMSEGFRGVPGVPDGWELVHACRQAESEETYLTGDEVIKIAKFRTSARFPIIRKIEQPAKYRAFENADEFKPHRDRWVNRIDIRASEMDPGACLVVGYDDHGLWFASGDYHTWQAAFEVGRCFDDDGTPFGVKIDES